MRRTPARFLLFTTWLLLLCLPCMASGPRSSVPGFYDYEEVTLDDGSPGIRLVIRLFFPGDSVIENAEITLEDSLARGEPATALVSISSSEPDDAPGGGDGDTVDDIQGADYGTPDLLFELRAERSGSGSGRIYDVVYSATDEAGNRAETSEMVVVPHLQDGIDKRWRWRVHKGTATGVATELAALPASTDQDLGPDESSGSSSAELRTRRGIVRCIEVESSERGSSRSG